MYYEEEKIVREASGNSLFEKLNAAKNEKYEGEEKKPSLDASIRNAKTRTNLASYEDRYRGHKTTFDFNQR